MAFNDVLWAFDNPQKLYEQALYKDEVGKLKGKLKLYESKENHGQCQVKEVQRELMEMQKQLNDLEISKASLKAKNRLGLRPITVVNYVEH